MRISDMPTSLALSGEESVPIYDPNQAEVLERNRRVNIQEFKGIQGDRGLPGLSAYEIWLNLGNTGNQDDFINSVNGTDGDDGEDGADGKSAYQTWVDLGHTGTEQDFIDSLKGYSAYQIWVDDGNTGTIDDFLGSIRGPQGYSPYDIWLQEGNSGTPDDYLDAIRGKSAYEIWKDLGHTGSQTDFIEDLEGPQGPPGEQGPPGDSGGNGSVWYRGTTVPPNGTGDLNDYYLNTTNGDIYGPKTIGGWGSASANIKGPQGSVWYQGTSNPSNSVGVNGDYYLNTTTADVYRKSSGTWGTPIGNIKGRQGVQGTAGSVWRSGVAVPSDSLGINNDFYLRTTTGDVYKKLSGSWGSPTTNLTGPEGPPGSDSAFTTGDVKFTFKVIADPGWIMANDGTIGSASSGATTRANADTQALYELLWTHVDNDWAPVTGGRGSDAESDFNANKPLALPKMLGRALAVAGTGYGLSYRATGSFTGEETHTLAFTELPSEAKTFSILTLPPGSGLSHDGDDEGDRGILESSIDSGGGEEYSIMQPTVFLKVMIKL